MAKTSVGIYVSAKNVDIVEFAGSRNSPKLMNFIRQDISPPASVQKAEEQAVQAQPKKQDSVSQAIKDGLAKLNTIPPDVYTTLSLSDAMIRYFDMPALPKAEQAQAVRFEAKKYVPFKLEEIVSDFKVLTASRKKNIMEVFLIAATKEQLNSHMDKFKQAGTSAVGIDIIPFALMRMFLLCKKVQPNETVMTLYIDNDRETASIHILEMGMPFMSRDLNINSDDKEALFEKLASELRVSRDYYQRQKPSVEVSKIIVCGEPLFSGLDAYIADELKVITETLHEFSSIKGAEKTAPSAIIAMGAALEGLGRSNYSINLSPVAAAMKKRQRFSNIVAEAIAAVLIIALTFIYGGLKTGIVSARLKAVKKQAESLPKNTAGLEVKVLEMLKKKKVDKIRFLELISNNRTSWAEKLSSITEVLPDEIWIEMINATETLIRSGSKYPSSVNYNISIQGKSFSPSGSGETESINKFYASLKKDKGFMEGFENIELGSIDRTKIEQHWITSFAVTAQTAKQEQAQLDRRGRRR